MPKLKLTQKTITTQCRAPSPDERTASGKPVLQHVYFDTELTSFALVVRRPSKTAAFNATFMVIRSINNRVAKRAVGRYGDLTVEQARKKAREIIVEMDNGKGLAPEPEPSTLGDAVALHLESMRKRGCSAKSVTVLQDETKRHLSAWLPLPLTKITRAMCAQRHNELTRDSGPYLANRVFRHLRAVWKTACKLFETLPAQAPTVAVTWNEQRPSEARVLWPDLPAWWATVHTLQNPVRRDLQLFMLFTGLRATDARTVRWEDVDLEGGTLHRPNPKGGHRRAFTLPISTFVLGLLKRREAENRVLFPQGDEGWVFPTRLQDGRVGAVQVARESRYVRGEKGKKKHKLLPHPHALRRTFASAAAEAGVDWLTIKLLLNHARPKGDVTVGYVQTSLEHLRHATERVAEFLLAKAGQKKPDAQAG